MISSPATPTVCQIFKVATWHYRCRHHIKNNCIWDNVACYSAAKFTFPIEQPSNTYFLHFSFCFILIIPRLTELWPFKCQGHPLSLWCWPLTCNLEKFYSLISSFGMYNLKRQLWYLHLLTWDCPCNLLPGQPLLNMNIEGNFEATLLHYRWRHHHEKKIST